MSELRDTIEEAFSDDSGETTVSETTDSSDTERVLEVSEERVEETVSEETTATVEGDTGGEESASDESTDTPVEEAREENVEEVVVASESEKETLKAPTGWKPSMREHWAKLPDEVKAEVHRREVDIAKGMEQSAEARRFQESFAKRIQPYQAEFQSRGVNPMQAFDNYLSTAYNLRHAPEQEKAQLVAGIISQYGVSIEALDSVLVGNHENAESGGSQAEPGVLNAIKEAMGPVNQFMQNHQTQQIQQVETSQQAIQSEIATFAADAKNEFYADVKGDMANLLEAAAMRNQNMSLQDAYDRAILLHDDIAGIVSKRNLEGEAQRKDAAAKLARAKSVSIEGSPPDMTTGRGNSQASSLRGAIESAFNVDAME